MTASPPVTHCAGIQGTKNPLPRIALGLLASLTVFSLTPAESARAAEAPAPPPLVLAFALRAPGLQWLTRSAFVGVGERSPNEVIVRFYRLE